MSQMPDKSVNALSSTHTPSLFISGVSNRTATLSWAQPGLPTTMDDEAFIASQVASDLAIKPYHLYFSTASGKTVTD